MKRRIQAVLMIAFATTLSGCAASVGVTQAEDMSDEVRLECKSANQLGCRHKGRTYPWNAWVEVMGYDSKKFAVKDVQQSGSRAVVMVVER